MHLTASIRSWLNKTCMCWRERNQNKVLWDWFLPLLSLIRLWERKREKNVGYEILQPGEEKLQNKDPVKQYYCCSSPFRVLVIFSSLHMGPHLPTFTLTKRRHHLCHSPVPQRFPALPSRKMPSLWSNLLIKQNRTLYSQKSFFYLTASTRRMGEETITYKNRKWKREQSRNLLYPMMTQTSLPIPVATIDCQKLINSSLLCQFFSREIFHLYLSSNHRFKFFEQTTFIDP